MSEDLSNYKAPTSIEQNSTQGRNFPPFHLSLSIGSLSFQCSLVEGHIHAGVIENTVTHENHADNWDFPVNIYQNPNSTLSVKDVQQILKNHADEDSSGLEPAQKEVSIHSNSKTASMPEEAL